MLLARIPACRFLVGLSTLVGAGCQQDRPAASSPIALVLTLLQGAVLYCTWSYFQVPL